MASCDIRERIRILVHTEWVKHVLNLSHKIRDTLAGAKQSAAGWCFLNYHPDALTGLVAQY